MNKLTKIKDGAGNVIATLSYDARNRLTAATGTPQGNITYSYDALGRLTGRSLGASTTTYRYNETTGPSCTSWTPPAM